VASGELFKSLNVVPEITAVFEPELLTATETRPTKSLTGFPETSLTETTGCVPKVDRFVAEVACVVSTS
jgi:hypothetical protein